ncbi:Electron transfer flavoprotein alpha-subunit [Scheffersomyces stipitis CBS 6054]|uniref:Probable electron transfer flavoprotein subunit alpha n=1 Tax=Scheffersomyces stipitis (strain ATCC 58785 / CBS 6054 / NBRC 10063 / NRRL Y-11545) TaxID=322104 RepID=A3LWN0_PICST|nr:Electron transfer flavoprotein alpha-subunit [Scheffersomyces stipitis CBS 6054]ABN67662.1 Electron transfer flavoprotein alpha-subunit [Scheffersomyces stipitis CBS 6054]
MLRSCISKRLFSTTRARLDTLAFVEAAGGKISPASLSAITAAQQIGKPITALIVGEQGEAVSSEVGKIAGVSKALFAKGEQYNHYLAEELSPLIKDILSSSSDYTHFVTAASAVGKSVLPRLGALVDAQPISDIIKVESENTFVRPIYAGNALATVKSNDKLILVSVRASAFAPAELSGDGSVSVEEFATVFKSDNRTEFVSEDLVTSERPELGSASKVVAGGRGLKNKETFEQLIEPLASKLSAAVGASRAAVDSGFCDNSLQVGQTGKIVAPELYIAVGISGAIQHLAGMKDSKTIVAINKDPEAPIFNVADIGLVADLNEALPELTQKL